MIPSAALGLLLFLTVSCQDLLFEDRTLCPSFLLTKAVPPIDPKSWEELAIDTWEDGGLTGSRTATVYELNRGFYIEATKGRFFEAALLGGWPAEWISDGSLLVPEGEPCPDAVGAYYGLEVGTDEIYEKNLTLTSLYADVFFVVEGASSGYAVAIEVRGAVDGYRYPGSGLHYGPYRVPAEPLPNGRRHARIPRQLPFYAFSRTVGLPEEKEEAVPPGKALEALVADIFVENREKGTMTSYMTLPLGTVVTEGGYDWTVPTLEDIRVRIRLFDGSIASLSVSFAEWSITLLGDGGGKYEI